MAARPVRIADFQAMQRGDDSDPFTPDPAVLDAEATAALRRITGAPPAAADEGDRIAAELVAARLQALNVAATCTAEMSLSMIVDRVRRAAYLDDLEGRATDAQIVAEAERIVASFSDNRRTPDWRTIATTRAAGDLAVTTDESGVVVDARPAEMTPDRGPDVGVTHHTLTDAYAESEQRWSGAGVEDVQQASMFLVPSDLDFRGRLYRDAPELANIAERLIQQHGFLAELVNCQIRYYWRRKTGVSKGRVKIGYCKRASDLLGHFSGADFIIWLSATTARDGRFTDRQVEAAVFHQLLHIETDDEGNFISARHDFEGFAQEIRHYGTWTEDLKLVVPAFTAAQQMGLFDVDDGIDGEDDFDGEDDREQAARAGYVEDPTNGAGILIHDDGTPMTPEEIAAQEARELADDDLADPDEDYDDAIVDGAYAEGEEIAELREPRPRCQSCGRAYEDALFSGPGLCPACEEPADLADLPI